MSNSGTSPAVDFGEQNADPELAAAAPAAESSLPADAEQGRPASGAEPTSKSRFQKDATERLADTPAVMALGHCQPVALEWRDVSLKVTDSDGKEKAILDRVSGCVKPGELVAVIGASGAGKTSLLNCLARRNTRNEGSITVNGAPFTNELASHVAFVQQEDIFLGSLTVEEHLKYRAELSLPSSMPAEERAARVEQLIASLSLTKCRNRLIGNVAQAMTRGISGGERKRLAFASEIVSDPSLLFADEPTSGLDAYMAEAVVMSLRQLAAAGRTVVATIHQPSSEVYQLFDKVLFLAEGRIAYFGDREEAVNYFAAMRPPRDLLSNSKEADEEDGEADAYSCPQFSNPADFLIRVLAKEPPQSTDEAKKQAHLAREHARIVAITDAWDRYMDEHPEELEARSPSGRKMSVEALVKYTHARTSWCHAFSVLTRRSFVNTLRDPVTTRARLAQAIFLSVMCGLIYLQLGDTQVDVQNKNGAIFFLLINQCMSAMFGVLQVFPLERPMFMREHESGLYGTSVYFLSKTISDLPSQIIPNFLFVTIAWWMVDLRDDVGAYLLFLCIVVMAANAAISLGYVISTATPSVTVALAVGPALILPFMLFAGFFVNTESIPVYFLWLEVLSFFKYGFSTGAVAVWEDVELECDTNSQVPCVVSSGNQVLQSLSLSPDDKFRDFMALGAMAVGFRVLAYILLRWRANGKRQNE